MTSQQSSWPGERYPSHRDVEVANESLEPGFLQDFKRALLASSAAQNNQALMHTSLANVVSVRILLRRLAEEILRNV
jgi:hypothetical protein